MHYEFQNSGITFFISMCIFILDLVEKYFCMFISLLLEVLLLLTPFVEARTDVIIRIAL